MLHCRTQAFLNLYLENRDMPFLFKFFLRCGNRCKKIPQCGLRPLHGCKSEPQPEFFNKGDGTFWGGREEGGYWLLIMHADVLFFVFSFVSGADVNRLHLSQNKGMHIYFSYLLTSLHYYYYRVSTNITFINYFYEFVLLFVLLCIIIYHYSRWNKTVKSK